MWFLKAVPYSMMSQAMILAYPDLFPSTEHVLNHLFIRSDTGAYWNDGGIRHTYFSKDSEIAFALQAFKQKTLQEYLRERHIRQVNNYKVKFGKYDDEVVYNFFRNKKAPKELGSFDPISVNSNIANIPNTVRKDWLMEAYRLLYLIKNKRPISAHSIATANYYIAKTNKQFNFSEPDI